VRREESLSYLDRGANLGKAGFYLFGFLHRDIFFQQGRRRINQGLGIAQTKARDRPDLFDNFDRVLAGLLKIGAIFQVCFSSKFGLFERVGFVAGFVVLMLLRLGLRVLITLMHFFLFMMMS
jgi:hypothetical protein